MKSKIAELQRRTVAILEKTRKEAQKYIIERKKVDEFFRYCKDNEENYIIEWEDYLKEFEEKVKEND